jgi:hypothetical protein
MSDIETKKKYVRPVIKLIELARDQVKSRSTLIQVPPGDNTSNVTGNTALFGG